MRGRCELLFDIQRVASWERETGRRAGSRACPLNVPDDSLGTARERGLKIDISPSFLAILISIFCFECLLTMATKAASKRVSSFRSLGRCELGFEVLMRASD